MLLTPPPSRFRAVYSNVTGTRPASAFGTTITPGNNTYGSFTQVLTALATEAYDLKIQISSNNVSAAARDTILTLGIDPAGGTTYTDWINHLLCTSAAPWPIGVGYHFPIHIPSGATVAAKASVNNATVGTLRIALYAFAKPDRPEMHRYGHAVETLGAVTASSRGTTVTSGTTADGSWTSIGTTTKQAWWWQAGMGINDSIMANNLYTLDVSHGASNVVIYEDQAILVDTIEELVNQPDDRNRVFEVATNTEIFARLQCSGTADAGLSVAVYALR